MSLKKPHTRIIGGSYKGTKISFTASKDLRPTENRTRETLFNWLMFNIEDSICLDMFAGTGALGIEALSRGAKRVTFIEKNQKFCRIIEKALVDINAEERSEVINSDSLRYLERKEGEAFDIIFVDPPFRKGLIEKSCNLFKSKNLLKKDGLIYIEQENEFNLIDMVPKLQEIKASKAGQTKFGLYRYED